MSRFLIFNKKTKLSKKCHDLQILTFFQTWRCRMAFYSHNRIVRLVKRNEQFVLFDSAFFILLWCRNRINDKHLFNAYLRCFVLKTSFIIPTIEFLTKSLYFKKKIVIWLLTKCWSVSTRKNRISSPNGNAIHHFIL